MRLWEVVVVLMLEKEGGVGIAEYLGPSVCIFQADSSIAYLLPSKAPLNLRT
jgi:hypothetical protein